MIVTPLPVRAALILAGLAVALAPAAGCGTAPAAHGAVASPTAVGDLAPASRLAARTALAQDLYYSAEYQFTPADGGPAQAVRVARVRGGFALELTDGDVQQSSITNASGSFRCRVTSSAAACVPGTRASAPDGDSVSRLAAVFTQWLRVLADRSAALSIMPAPAPQGASGTCFSVEGVAAALEPPVDPGLYCFDERGLVTVAQLPCGSLTLTGNGPAPADLALPAPVTQTLPDPPVPPAVHDEQAPSPSAAGSAA